jgi:hypothetical protein
MFGSREFLIDKYGEVSLWDIHKYGSIFRCNTNVNVVTPDGSQMHSDSVGWVVRPSWLIDSYELAN